MKQKTCPKCKGKGTIPDMATRGAALRKLREKSGFSVRQLAAAVGISPTHLSDVERNRHNMSLELEAKIKQTIANLSAAK